MELAWKIEWVGTRPYGGETACPCGSVERLSLESETKKVAIGESWGMF